MHMHCWASRTRNHTGGVHVHRFCGVLAHPTHPPPPSPDPPDPPTPRKPIFTCFYAWITGSLSSPIGPRRAHVVHMHSPAGPIS